MPNPDVDVLIVGAGFAGLAALHRLRGLGLRARVLEAAQGVGGTWYWNRYPGARCDVESLDYSYQFSAELQQDWEWTERYASQPEILRYLDHVADRFDLRRDIRLGTRVSAAHFNEAENRWEVSTATGERLQARWLVMATGCLSRPNKPVLPGLQDFAGEIYHTGEWPHTEPVFEGKRVGVVGTGSSAIQSIPVLAERAAKLYVFQRTPAYSVPARNGPLDPQVQAGVKADYAGFRAKNNATFGAAGFDTNEACALQVSAEERQLEYDKRWARGGLPFMLAFADLILHPDANATAAEYVRAKIREAVKDPAVAELLSPYHTFACKRLCADTGYFETFNRPNVTLVDVRSHAIERVTRTAVVTENATYELDCIVFATGFDAMTGALLAIDIHGREGVRLKDAWQEGPKTYLGLATAGFPNLFTISGPGSPSVLSNMVPTIEQHVGWIAECIGYMESHHVRMLEAEAGAQEEWVAHVNFVATQTLYPSCNSWYLGANVPGKPQVFMPYSGGFPAYTAKCNEVAARGYAGFIHS